MEGEFMKKNFLLGALIFALVFGLIGCGNGDDTKDPPETEPPLDPALCTTLTVKNLPKEVGIIGASLVGQDEKPVATAMGNGGVYIFSEPTPGSFFPSKKPWKGKGDFIVVLAKLAPGTTIPGPNGEGTIQYLYAGFDVSAIMNIVITDENQAKAELATLLSNNQVLAGQVVNIQTTMMYHFDNTATVELLWSNFISRSWLNIILAMKG
jgi:hypothetical protein